jgi:DNA-binding transcriptional LysR family regulator
MNHLRLLRYIDEVARAGSVRRAAERLHISPSAVMRRVQDVEEELGTPIFERLAHGMRLTAAGELFVHYIRTRSADLERVRSEIEDLQGLRRGTVQLIASQALASAFLPAAIARFHAAHALIEFQVRIGDRSQALDTLRSFDADLAIVFNLAHEPDIERIESIEQRLCVMMHRDHPLAAHEGPLRLRDCAEYPLVMPYREIGGRQLLDQFLARRSLKLHAMIESNSFEFMHGYLRHTQALSFQIAIGAVTQGGQLVSREIGDAGFPRGQLVLASLRGRQLPAACHAFAEHLGTEMLEQVSATAKKTKR